MTDVIEKAARAMSDRLYAHLPDTEREETFVCLKNNFIDEARAALKVILQDMMEPSSEQQIQGIQAGCNEIREFSEMLRESDADGDYATAQVVAGDGKLYKAAWKAMLTAYAHENGIELESEQ